MEIFRKFITLMESNYKADCSCGWPHLNSEGVALMLVKVK